LAYAGLFVTLLVQALRGQSILQPDAMTVTMLAGVVLVLAVSWLVAGWRPRPAAVPAIL